MARIDGAGGGWAGVTDVAIIAVTSPALGQGPSGSMWNVARKS